MAPVPRPLSLAALGQVMAPVPRPPSYPDPGLGLRERVPHAPIERASETTRAAGAAHYDQLEIHPQHVELLVYGSNLVWTPGLPPESSV